MENLKDILSSFTERVKSPFYGTFFICWLIINWKVVFIAFGDSIGTDDKISRIGAELEKHWISIGFPIIAAVIFLLGYRWIEVFASLYVSFLRSVKEDKELKQVGKHSISGVKYVEVTKKLENLSKTYINLRGERAQVESELIEATDTVNKYRKENAELHQKLRDKPKFDNKNNLAGEWVVRYSEKTKSKSTGFDMDISINNANIEFIKHVGPNNKETLGFMHCYENILQDFGFAVHSINSSQLFILGRFTIIEKEENGSFNQLRGWLKSNDPDYNCELVHLYRKSFYEHLRSLSKMDE